MPSAAQSCLPPTRTCPATALSFTCSMSWKSSAEHSEKGDAVAITPEIYRLFEEIVGSEHVSDDPAVLDSYAFEVLADLVRPDQSHFMPRPAAVVLPAGTEEVQALVRVCNEHRIKV